MPYTALTPFGVGALASALPAPVSEWKFEQNAFDTYGINNGTRYNFTNGYATGKYGYALEFNSSAEQYVDVGNDSSLNFGTGDFSLEVWVKRTSAIGFEEEIISKYPNSYWLAIEPNYITFGTDGENIVTTNTVCDDKWHNIVAVRNGYNLAIYVDGSLAYSEEMTTIDDVSNTNPVFIGAYISDGGTSGHFNGTIDEVRIYDYALSDAEVLQLYNKTLTDCAELSESGSYYLTADIINSSVTYCMDITANNIVLDCGGHVIDGDDYFATYGIYIYRSSINETNITVANCEISDYYYGIYLENSENNVISNITAYSNAEGIHLHDKSSNNIFTNINASYNDIVGISLEGNASYNLFENIIANNNADGVYVYSSNFNNLANINASHNSGSGILFGFSNNNTVTNYVAEDNDYGIMFTQADNNTIANCTTNYNRYEGMSIENSNNNSISDCVISHGLANGITLDSSNSNYIYRNVLSNNTGVGLGISGGSNKIYNNLFNNINNVYFSGTVYANEWNVAKQSGARIYSAGTQIGGNYWVGYSEPCRDVIRDGFCDEKLTLAENNVDNLPYSDNYIAGYWLVYPMFLLTTVALALIGLLFVMKEMTVFSTEKAVKVFIVIVLIVAFLIAMLGL
jgi:parallel beta-helix repeat protein